LDPKLKKILGKKGISEFLNCELAEKDKGETSLSMKVRLKNENVLRTVEDEIELEKNYTDRHYDNENLVFRGTFDGICHYLIAILVFGMPLFIPYIHAHFGSKGNNAPTLLTATIFYVLFSPLIAWGLVALSNYFNRSKLKFLERFFIGCGAAVGIFLIYFALCRLGVLPYFAFKTNRYLSGATPLEDQLQLWFSTFSYGKFYFTYITTILITAVFYYNNFSIGITLL